MSLVGACSPERALESPNLSARLRVLDAEEIELGDVVWARMGTDEEGAVEQEVLPHPSRTTGGLWPEQSCLDDVLGTVRSGADGSWTAVDVTDDFRCEEGISEVPDLPPVNFI